MSSHGLTVPQGWTKGRQLVVLRNEPPVAVAQELDLARDPVGSIGHDDVAYITFDSQEDAVKFINWWNDERADNGDAAK